MRVTRRYDLVQLALVLLVAAFAFLSARFSFRDFAAAVLLLLFLGDLSAIGHSVPRKHDWLRLALTLRHLACERTTPRAIQDKSRENFQGRSRTLVARR